MPQLGDCRTRLSVSFNSRLCSHANNEAIFRLVQCRPKLDLFMECLGIFMNGISRIFGMHREPPPPLKRREEGNPVTSENSESSKINSSQYTFTAIHLTSEGNRLRSKHSSIKNRPTFVGYYVAFLGLYHLQKRVVQGSGSHVPLLWYTTVGAVRNKRPAQS
jgi:hypothetical protein